MLFYKKKCGPFGNTVYRYCAIALSSSVKLAPVPKHWTLHEVWTFIKLFRRKFCLSNSFKLKQTCAKLGSIGHWICKRIMTENKTRVALLCVLLDAYYYLSEEFYLFLKNDFFRGSRFSHCSILTTALSIARYKVSCYANNYFE